MPEQEVTRRLAAIMAADVVGYSRLMGTDEVGTLTAMKKLRRDTLDPSFARHHGRVVKTTGDGVLVEFASASDAVRCGIAVQRALIDRNSAIPEDRRIVLRLGINVGDIIFEDGDIFGDGVNIAARLESLCPPGGLCISRTAHDQVVDKLSCTFTDFGEQAVKNIARPVGVFGLTPDDIAEMPAADQPEATSAPAETSTGASTLAKPHQEIRFCLSPDGVQLAYSKAGEGPPLLKAPNWISHLEHEWESPIWRHMLDELRRDHTLVRFDQRANGLSDWNVGSFSLEEFVSDMETVVDAAGLEQFPIVGISQGCAISIAYARRNPERVRCLVLYGGFARGAFHRGDAAREQAEAMITLIRLGWGSDNPAFRQMFTSSFIPEGTHEQMEWLNEMERLSISAENAAATRRAVSDFNVVDRLRDIACPTLVLHCRDDAMVPFNEGKLIASGIPDARFVALDGSNHLIFEHEPAWTRFRDELRAFLAKFA